MGAKVGEWIDGLVVAVMRQLCASVVASVLERCTRAHCDDGATMKRWNDDGAGGWTRWNGVRVRDQGDGASKRSTIGMWLIPVLAADGQHASTREARGGGRRACGRGQGTDGVHTCLLLSGPQSSVVFADMTVSGARAQGRVTVLC